MGAVSKVICGLLAVLVPIGMVFGFLMDAGVVPSDRVLDGNNIPPDQYAILQHEGIIEAGEVVEYFYSEGLLSVREGGSVLTNQRVISYEENVDNGITIFQLRHEDITSVDMTQEGDALNFAVYTVSGDSVDNWLDLWLPHDHGDGEKFANAVRAKIR